MNESAQAVTVEPAFVLGCDATRLIDGWQVEVWVWDHVLGAVEPGGRPGRLPLAGSSAVPADDATIRFCRRTDLAASRKPSEAQGGAA